MALVQERSVMRMPRVKTWFKDRAACVAVVTRVPERRAVVSSFFSRQWSIHPCAFSFCSYKISNEDGEKNKTHKLFILVCLWVEMLMLNVPSIAQLVERRTVETLIDILRSLVRIRLEGDFFCFLCYFCNVCVADWILLSFILVWRRTSLWFAFYHL